VKACREEQIRGTEAASGCAGCVLCASQAVPLGREGQAAASLRLLRLAVVLLAVVRLAVVRRARASREPGQPVHVSSRIIIAYRYSICYNIYIYIAFKSESSKCKCGSTYPLARPTAGRLGALRLR
jgi:hypothetical protein